MRERKRDEGGIERKRKCFEAIDLFLQHDDIGPRSKVSLLDQHTELKKKAEGNCYGACRAFPSYVTGDS